jgi:hypothetical protein
VRKRSDRAPVEDPMLATLHEPIPPAPPRKSGASSYALCQAEERRFSLSEARRSVATERESKDPCTLSLERCHQGILTVPSVIKLFAVCKCQENLPPSTLIYLSS